MMSLATWPRSGTDVETSVGTGEHPTGAAVS
jgi:hypothetical protein